jgi:CubicO group peptidase (beta-lactamase class C family)
VKALIWSATASALLALEVAAAGAADLRNDKAKAGVDEIFADLTAPGSPGCALAVAQDGKILYEKGYGLASIELNVPITPETVFDIGSTSKQFTAASILLLEKQGKLKVDDDVRKYIPELPDYGKKITILNLLNHTSGLRDYLELMALGGIDIDGVTDDDDALNVIVHQKALNFDPGSKWQYSNTGFFLLSLIVKRVSGKTLAAFAADNIFGPLAMKTTEYRADHTRLVPNRALAYKERGRDYALDVSYFEQTGDGAVHTSVEDLLKWDENFYSGQVGGKAFLRELQENGRLNDGRKLDYAKGLFVRRYRGLPTVDHGGAWGGYRAQLLRFPEQHFSVACLCNVGNANPEKRAYRVADAYLGSQMQGKEEGSPERKEAKKALVSPTAEQLRGLDGDYYSEELQVTYTLEVQGTTLKLKEIAGSPFLKKGVFSSDVFTATGDDTFLLRDESLSIHFQRSPNGGVEGFALGGGRVQGILFSKTAKH